jgi:hypothetical protein
LQGVVYWRLWILGHISPIPFGFEGCVPQQPPSPSLRVLPTAATEPDTPAAEQPAPSPPAPSRRQRPQRRNRKPAQCSQHIQLSSHAISTGPATATSKLFTGSFTSHYAMHGTAVNPETGGIAEYKELSTCSDSNSWQASNADEIGRMFQGLGLTPTCQRAPARCSSLIKKNFPKTRNLFKYVLYAPIDPKRPTPSESVGQLVATRLNTLATSPPKPPTSKLPNACSTALSAPPMTDS